MTADRRRGVRCVSRQWSVLYVCVKIFECIFFLGWGVVFIFVGRVQGVGLSISAVEQLALLFQSGNWAL
jgi:hypothetical protein